MRKFPLVEAGTFVAAGLVSAALLGISATGDAFADQKVGVAAAVKPEATSQQPGGETTTLKIGKSVVYNERINTSGSGVVQVLLVDGSTFTVGPGSSLVIDKFVYNPASGKGSLVASFSKGALRFVGGKLSKNDPGVTVKTPAGALTVRGGMFEGKVNGPNSAFFTFVFGISLTLDRHGHLLVTRTPGDVFSIANAGPAIVRPRNMADVQLLQASLYGTAWKKTAMIKLKGQRWPYYYGIQPAGRYPDQPFIRQLYYDGATTQLLLSGMKPVPLPEPPVTQVPITTPGGGGPFTHR